MPEIAKIKLPNGQTYDIKGTPGPTGAAGPTGPQGIQGPTGQQGDVGPVGPTGRQGEVGPTGPTGIKGDTGLQGNVGPTGPKGDTGEAFTIAKVYDSVSAMNSGYSNDDVKTGQFVIIETGDVNDVDNAKLYVKGNSKYEYLTDLSGAQGMQGPTGATGATGNVGPTGAVGSIGPTGPKGDKGETGTAAGFGTPTATIDNNVGTPQVTVTSSGNDTSKVFSFDFKNLKGETGKQGTQGINLLLNSAEEKTSQVKDAAAMGPYYELTEEGKFLLNEIGTPFTLSYEAKSSIDGPEIYMNVRVGTGNSIQASPTHNFVKLTTEYKRYSFSDTIIKEGAGRVWVLMQKGASDEEIGATISVRNIKLELDTVDNPVWTPSQEDLKDHVHNASDINSGVLSVEHGGTGEKNMRNAAIAFINSLTTGTGIPNDDTYFISQNVNGETTYNRRSFSTIWDWLCNEHIYKNITSEEDSWETIGISPNKSETVLKVIRGGITTNAPTPPSWFAARFGAGIAFGGSDTKGVMSVDYRNPKITLAGGSTSSTSSGKPMWYMSITGENQKTYNLSALENHTHDVNPLALGLNASAAASNSVAIGYSTTSKSTGSTAIGCLSQALAANSTALGSSANASGGNSIAIGDNAIAENIASIAIGFNAIGANNSYAIGRQANATGYNSIAIGRESVASGTNSIVLGRTSSAEGNNTIAIGLNSNAINNDSIAIGFNSNANSTGAIAIGKDTFSNGNALAIGYNAQSSGGRGSTAVGYCSNASGESSTAVGISAYANGENSIALGFIVHADGNWSTAIGHRSTAAYENSIAIGSNSNAAYNGSIAIGFESNAIYNNAIAIGLQSNAINNDAIAIGRGSYSNKGQSISIGVRTEAIATNAIAIGYFTNANGISSVAIAPYAKTNGQKSISIGESASSASNSVALGPYAAANQSNSVAIGYGAHSVTSDNIQLGNASTLSSITARVNITTDSDERDKTDISVIDNGATEFLQKIKAVRYVLNHRELYIDEENLSDEEREKKNKYGMCAYDKESHKQGTKKGNRVRVGVIAQELQSALKEVYGDASYADLVNDNFFDYDQETIPDGVENKLSVNYTGLIPFLIKAVQELSDRITELEEKL